MIMLINVFVTLLALGFIFMVTPLAEFKIGKWNDRLFISGMSMFVGAMLVLMVIDLMNTPFA